MVVTSLSSSTTRRTKSTPSEVMPDEVSSAFSDGCGLSTSSSSTGGKMSSSSTDAFINVDIVDGDIVSINTKRQSPVSYTDFPDIFDPTTEPSSISPSSSTSSHLVNHDETNTDIIISSNNNNSSATTTKSQTSLSTSNNEQNNDKLISKTIASTDGTSHTDPHLQQETTINTTPINRQAKATSLREQVRLGITRRTEFPLVHSRVALLVVDVQTFACSEQCTTSEYYHQDAKPRMLDNIQNHLLPTFRTHRDKTNTTDITPEEDGQEGGCEVIFTVIQSRTKDRRDISLDYKLSGAVFGAIPTIETPQEEVFLPSIQPDQFSGKGDIIIPKTSCSVFQSTNLDYTLRNLNVEQLVICGQVTEQCVESAVRDAADLGYLVTVVEDACAAHSINRHTDALDRMKGFARICSTAQIVSELNTTNSGIDRNSDYHPPCPITTTTTANTLNSVCNQTDNEDENQNDSKTKRVITPVNHEQSQYDSSGGMLVRATTANKTGLSSNRPEIASITMALLRSLQHGSVTFLRYMWVDIDNTIQCQDVPIDQLLNSDEYRERHQSDTLEYPVVVSYEKEACKDDEFVMQPDLATLQILPYSPSTAVVLGTLEAINSRTTIPSDVGFSQACTRQWLQSLCQKHTETNRMNFLVQAEVQFSLHVSATGKPIDTYTSTSVANRKRLTEQRLLIDDLYHQLKAQHIVVNTIKAGSSPGQLGIVLGHQDPVRLADSFLLAQETTRAVAATHSLKALFLPYAIREGDDSVSSSRNGLQLFISMEQEMTVEKRGLPTASSSNAMCSKRELMGDVGGSFVQGILTHLPALSGITLPTVNSYRQLQTATRLDCSWSFDNRSKKAPVRVSQNSLSRTWQVEYNLCDNTCNLYATIASLLICGMDGVTKKLTLQPSLEELEKEEEDNVDNLHIGQKLPTSLKEAIQNLEEDSELTDLFDIRGLLAKYLVLRKYEANRSCSFEDEIKEALEKA